MKEVKKKHTAGHIVLCMVLLCQAYCVSAAAEEGLLVINEIHADPDTAAGDANRDGIRDSSDDEFIELVNNSTEDLDISGWSLKDNSSVRHVFPPGTKVPAGCVIVVFGGGTPAGFFCGNLIQTASTGRLGLNNTGDTVFLSDGISDIDVQSFGSEGGDNQALTRSPDISGPFLKHSVAEGSDGSLFSPGTMLDGSCFPGCEDPTMVSILYFHAYHRNNKTLLSWATASETQNAGFNILRYDGEIGEYIRTNSLIIPARGTVTEGAEYEFTDNDLEKRTRYYYRLEAVDLNGDSTTHGPVEATPRWIHRIKTGHGSN